jgi:hypothetical protein
LLVSVYILIMMKSPPLITVQYLVYLQTNYISRQIQKSNMNKALKYNLLSKKIVCLLRDIIEFSTDL